MDFFRGLPLTPSKKDSIWVIVDRLTKSTHFILVYRLFVKEVGYQFLSFLIGILVSRINFGRSYISLLMAPYEALYGHKCRTPLCWTELGEKKIIWDHLKAASDRQKSYSELKRKDTEFSVGDQVFLKVSSWKKVS
ncbi:reverse transcriptase [Gossypium australe]|uniref:Reverse transcriptase n=1 Tax=Gossypium australe TaxID=47621 RepID=A0A5B6UXH8_9ROSI|nr:reverse transcriptase [Gossypium australe]